MKNFIVYDESSGEILKSVVVADSQTAEMQASDGQNVLFESGSDENHYVDISDYTVKEKIDNPCTLSGATLSSLPLPCTVAMRGPTSAEVYVEQDGLTLDADVPGRYRVTVVADHPKYYDAAFEVDL